MSDFQVGAGWWQASDGRWYPPELHPQYRKQEPIAPTTSFEQPHQAQPQPQQPQQAQPQPQQPQQPQQAQPQPQQPQPGQSPYGQTPYGQQAPYGQNPSGQQAPYGQNPSGQQAWYGQDSYGRPPQQPPTQQYTPLGGTAPGGSGQYGSGQYAAGQYGSNQHGATPYSVGPLGGVTPTHAPPAKKSNAGKWLIGVIAVLVVLSMVGVAVLFAARGSGSLGSVIGVSSDSVESKAGGGMTSKGEGAGNRIQITDGGGPTDDLVASAIIDVQAFWAKEMPQIFNTDYKPISGAYAVSPGDPLPPCVDNGDQVAGNAYYCSTRDIIAWDDSTLIPDLERTYGELSVAIVFAHELGHAVQARTRMDGQTVTLEQQADCYAGAWVKRVKEGESDYFTMTTESLDRALGGFLEIADTPGTAAEDPNAHGSAFDRINSFQDGFEDGASKCARYDDQTVGSRLVEVPFQSVEDYQRGGNAPYGEIMDLTTKDLEDFWTKAGENTYGKAWTPLSSAKPFRGKDEAPECGDGDTEGYSLFYCSDGRFIAYDNVGLFPKVYQQVGDFGVSTLYATQYALAAQETFDLEGSSTKAKNLMADCLSGAWTGSVFSEDRGSDARLSLSPGDFDEAVKTLLLFGGKTASEVKTVGSGFERVSAFRNGVTGGLTACSK